MSPNDHGVVVRDLMSLSRREEHAKPVRPGLQPPDPRRVAMRNMDVEAQLPGAIA
jgi:hypothetical protein